MFGLVVRFTVRDGAAGEFDRLVDQTVPEVHRHEPRTLVYAVHEVDGEPNVRVFYELYRDRAAFDEHERTRDQLSVVSGCGSWPVTWRQPALGTNIDDEPESHLTVIIGPSTAVTTPLRVALPTFSDSTSTRSPISTMSTSLAADGTRLFKSPQTGYPTQVS